MLFEIKKEAFSFEPECFFCKYAYKVLLLAFEVTKRSSKKAFGNSKF